MTEILVEVLPLPTSSGLEVRGATGVVATTAEALASVGDAIAEACRSVFESARQSLADAQPNELEVEFGVSLAGEAGIPLIGSVSSTATFKVTAKWLA